MSGGMGGEAAPELLCAPISLNSPLFFVSEAWAGLGSHFVCTGTGGRCGDLRGEDVVWWRWVPVRERGGGDLAWWWGSGMSRRWGCREPGSSTDSAGGWWEGVE